jgi:hypothetical protein
VRIATKLRSVTIELVSTLTVPLTSRVKIKHIPTRDPLPAGLSLTSKRLKVYRSIQQRRVQTAITLQIGGALQKHRQLHTADHRLAVHRLQNNVAVTIALVLRDAGGIRTVGAGPICTLDQIVAIPQEVRRCLAAQNRSMKAKTTRRAILHARQVRVLVNLLRFVRRGG